jgi:hypothetical protein
LYVHVYTIQQIWKFVNNKMKKKFIFFHITLRN